MSQVTFGYTLYLLLYSVFWSALAVIVYRAAVVDGPLDVTAGLYCFLLGLVCLTSGVLRMMRLRTITRSRQRRPIVGSLYGTGLILIITANFI